jgi:hypothetical protein
VIKDRDEAGVKQWHGARADLWCERPVRNCYRTLGYPPEKSGSGKLLPCRFQPIPGWMTGYPEVETDGRGGAAHQKGQSQIQISRYITWIDSAIMLHTGVAGEKVRADYDLHI